jgi:hypothetical protein
MHKTLNTGTNFLQTRQVEKDKTWKLTMINIKKSQNEEVLNVCYMPTPYMTKCFILNELKRIFLWPITSHILVIAKRRSNRPMHSMLPVQPIVQNRTWTSLHLRAPISNSPHLSTVFTSWSSAESRHVSPTWNQTSCAFTSRKPFHQIFLLWYLWLIVIN